MGGGSDDELERELLVQGIEAGKHIDMQVFRRGGGDQGSYQGRSCILSQISLFKPLGVGD